MLGKIIAIFGQPVPRPITTAIEQQTAKGGHQYRHGERGNRGSENTTRGQNFLIVINRRIRHGKGLTIGLFRLFFAFF